ncbi:MAG: hypothetical protein WGN25_14790 [Candidatus Electrothrix sp. GW3-4]|uniref:hypothetical protein n=1 Tax=Candidatus Electrothrix sp. GW3-4 TaxID=3126740 RepID=UPI0030CBEAAA
MKIKLHRPNRNLWNVAMVLFIVGMLGSFLAIPIVSPVAFHLVALAAVLLLLGTWAF